MQLMEGSAGTQILNANSNHEFWEVVIEPGFDDASSSEHIKENQVSFSWKMTLHEFAGSGKS